MSILEGDNPKWCLFDPHCNEYASPVYPILKHISLHNFEVQMRQARQVRNNRELVMKTVTLNVGKPLPTENVVIQPFIFR